VGLLALVQGVAFRWVCECVCLDWCLDVLLVGVVWVVEVVVHCCFLLSVFVFGGGFVRLIQFRLFCNCDITCLLGCFVWLVCLCVVLFVGVCLSGGGVFWLCGGVVPLLLCCCCRCAWFCLCFGLWLVLHLVLRVGGVCGVFVYF